MQPTAPFEETESMAPVRVKSIFRTGLRGNHQGSVETAMVPLSTEQVHAVGKQIGLLKRETTVSWLAELTILKGSASYMIVDFINVMQECMESQYFAVLSLGIKNRRAQSAAVIRDKALTLSFTLEPIVVLFHKERQANGERPEAYNEHKKLLFVAAGLAQMRNDSFDFDIPEWKHPLINRFSPGL